jgi:hypothetical protein
MSARVRRPTDEVATRVFDEEGRQRTQFGATMPAAGSAAAPPEHPGQFEPFELDATEVTPMPGRAQLEQATPTHVDPAPVPPGAPVALRGARRSEPIQAISMKDRGGAQKPRNDDQRVPLHVQLRSIAEAAGMQDSGIGLGHLAPPRDPRQAQARRVRSNVVWACVAIVLACVIMLVVWFVAGK